MTSPKFTEEFVDQEGAVHETTIRAEDEDEAMDIFTERHPQYTATCAYPKETP